MSVHLAPIGNAFQFLDANGRPLALGQLYTYQAGTTTPQATFTTSAGNVSNTNPIVLNSDGRTPQEIWLTDAQAYKFVLKDVLGNVIATYDNLAGIGDNTGLLSTLASQVAPTGASLVGYLQPAAGGVGATVQGKLQKLVTAADFGAPGDGTLQTLALQAALNAAAGGTLYIGPGDYITTALLPLANTTIVLDGGARLVGRTSGNNFIFAFSNPVLATIGLTTATAGAVSCIVTNGAAFSANDRVIVSAGTFTGSGVEEGPIEFNTVLSVVGNTLNLVSPLQYSYSAFGIAGAAPRVLRLGSVDSIVRNVRVTGGRMCGEASFSGLTFGFGQVENITIDNVRVESDPATGYVCYGTGLTTGGKLSRLFFHHNIVRGTGGTATGVMFNLASMCDSNITENVFNVGNEDTVAHQSNHLTFEVTCRDNLIGNNVIGPIRYASSAAIEFTFNSFGNRIQGNTIWGLDSDIVAAVNTLGIRTYANSSGFTYKPNLITGNMLQSIMTGIGDAIPATTIAGNVHWNQTLHANSTGILTPSNALAFPLLSNTFVNITKHVQTDAGAAGGLIVDAGTGDPSDYGNQGSIYMRKDGTAGHTLFFRENINGTLAWFSRNRPPTTTFANIPGTGSEGEVFYVTDGTPGSNPLTGAGAGCLAVRNTGGGSWRGI